jgi:uncharacterized protein (TIGR03086 family)
MEPGEQLRRAADEFGRRVRHVQPGHLALPTPCPAWDVAALLQHVVGADLAYVALLHGGSADDFVRITSETEVGEDPAAAFAASSSAVMAAYAEDGALEPTVHHAIGDIPAMQLLGMRVTDWVIHGWDLARAIGADDHLDDDLVDLLLARTQARGEALYSSGYFQRGRGVTATASAQDQVLDLLAARQPRVRPSLVRPTPEPLPASCHRLRRVRAPAAP